MKKKALVLWMLLALSLTTLLTGCGTDDNDVAGSISPSYTESAPAKDKESTEAPAAEETTEKTATEDTAAEDTAEEDPEDRPLKLGRAEGNVYTNEYIGYACELDADWVIYPAEELQELPDNISEALSDTEAGDVLEGVQQITDMLAENVSDMTTINVLFQKLSLQERLVYSAMDEKEILELTLEQSEEMLQEAYAQMGIEVEGFEIVSVSFLGEERTALKMTSQLQGVPYYTLQIYDYDLGEYFATTTLASFNEDNTESLLDLFHAID